MTGFGIVASIRIQTDLELVAGMAPFCNQNRRPVKASGKQCNRQVCNISLSLDLRIVYLVYFPSVLNRISNTC